MPKQPLDSTVADQAPTSGEPTNDDHEHLVTYLRLSMVTPKVPIRRK